MPKIAVLLDENTSQGGTQFQLGKAYVAAIKRAGGQAYGVFYEPDMMGEIADEFDGLLCPGGRFAYPDEYYHGNWHSNSDKSDRFEAERRAIEQFLAMEKPVLGMCAGMQLLACMHGAKMTPDLVSTIAGCKRHDGPKIRHRIDVIAGTKLHKIVGVDSFEVNSLHREALVECPKNIVISALSDDGLIEAIELPEHKFAVGLQWHQEKFFADEHPGNKVFDAFIAAAS